MIDQALKESGGFPCSLDFGGSGETEPVTFRREMLEEVLTQNSLNGNSQSADLVSVDTFNFKTTQVCDGYVFRHRPAEIGDSSRHMSRGQFLRANPKSVQKLVPD
jgi:hypothetical protein